MILLNKNQPPTANIGKLGGSANFNVSTQNKHTIEQMEIKRLYHYTTINTLALILSSKQIRFNRLDKVNDPTEGLTKDFDDFSKYLFVSCWTNNSDENLAMWNMYTPEMIGVRIELELPIFNSYTIDPKIESDYFPDKYEHLLTKKTPPSIDNYYIKINDKSFVNMKILLGPKLKFGDREIIESLVEKYNKKATISDSKIDGLIR